MTNSMVTEDKKVFPLKTSYERQKQTSNLGYERLDREIQCKVLVWNQSCTVRNLHVFWITRLKYVSKSHLLVGLYSHNDLSSIDECFLSFLLTADVMGIGENLFLKVVMISHSVINNKTKEVPNFFYIQLPVFWSGTTNNKIIAEPITVR